MLPVTDVLAVLVVQTAKPAVKAFTNGSGDYKLSVSVRIADIRKISIRGYISAHL